MQHGEPDQTEKQPVVPSADAVVEPLAVVVEVAGAPVALAAVLRLLLHVSLTPLTEPLIVHLWELLEGDLAVSLHSDSCVAGINASC